MKNNIKSIDEIVEKDKVIRKKRKKCPDFFICGAAKSGTTSLFNHLGQHPEIFTPDLKEPGYFSSLRPLCDEEQYLSIFEDACEHQLIGEASGAYLTSPDSAVRIAEAVPGAKIIIMLRNPAERAYSLYKWMAKEGYDYAGNFEEALHLEESKRHENPKFRYNNPEYHYNYLYFNSGLYGKQVKRYVENFPRRNLKFIIFEEFFSEEIIKVQKVYNFLGVKEKYYPNLKVYNEGKEVKNTFVQYTLNNYFKPVANRTFGKKGEEWIKKMMKKNVEQKHSCLDSSLRKKLLERYESDIRRTASLIGKDLEAVWLED